MNRRCIRVRLLQRRHEHVLPGLGAGQPVVFNHGWPLSSDAFEDQMFYLASNGYGCIAVDRRGHGRSDNATAMRSSKIVKDAVLKVYPAYPHGMPQTHKDVINADLLAFVQGKELAATTAEGA